MRGGDCVQGSMFSYVSLETRIPQDHPLRPMRTMVDAVSAEVLRQGRAGIRTMIPETRRSISAARPSRKKGQTSHLAYMGHLLTENRNGLIVSAMLTEANDHAERLVGLEMIEEVARARRITLGADRGFDTEDFVAGCRQRNVTPRSTTWCGSGTSRRHRLDWGGVLADGRRPTDRPRGERKPGRPARLLPQQLLQER